MQDHIKYKNKALEKKYKIYTAILHLEKFMSTCSTAYQISYNSKRGSTILNLDEVGGLRYDRITNHYP
jgi:hypothetical protein